MLRLLKYGAVIAAVYAASPLRDPGDAQLKDDAARLVSRADAVEAIARAASDHPHVVREVVREAAGTMLRPRP